MRGRMRFRIGRPRRIAERVAERVDRRLAVRLAGALVATGGLALMGFGTIGSPLSGGALADRKSVV